MSPPLTLMYFYPVKQFVKELEESLVRIIVEEGANLNCLSNYIKLPPILVPIFQILILGQRTA